MSPQKQFDPLTLLFGAVLSLAMAARLTMADIPLERDEGLYLYMGRLVLDGALPYVDIADMRFPGVFVLHAAAVAAGLDTARRLHLLLACVSAANASLVFLLGRRLFGREAGAAAGAVYAAASLGRALLGLSANNEHAVLLAVLGGTLLLAPPRGEARPVKAFAAGLLFGAAVSLKQTAAVFAVFGAWTLVSSGWALVLVFAAACALPMALLSGWLAANGAWPEFWFWTVRYAAGYASGLPLSASLGNLVHNGFPVLRESPLVWLAAAAGVAGAASRPDLRPALRWLAAFAAACAAAASAGLHFRQHAFQFLLPAVALGVAAGVCYLRDRFPTARLAAWAAAAVVGTAAAQPLLAHHAFFAGRTPEAASALIYGANPFRESVAIADAVRRLARPGDRLAVLGSEPQICLYAGIRCVSRFPMVYPLMEPHRDAPRLQREMTAALEAADPRFIVFVNVRHSWLPGPGTDPHLLEWSGRVLGDRYRRIGVADIRSVRETRYVWGPEADGYPPRSEFWLGLYERKG